MYSVDLTRHVCVSGGVACLNTCKICCPMKSREFASRSGIFHYRTALFTLPRPWGSVFVYACLCVKNVCTCESLHIWACVYTVRIPLCMRSSRLNANGYPFATVYVRVSRCHAVVCVHAETHWAVSIITYFRGSAHCGNGQNSYLAIAIALYHKYFPHSTFDLVGTS